MNLLKKFSHIFLKKAHLFLLTLRANRIYDVPSGKYFIEKIITPKSQEPNKIPKKAILRLVKAKGRKREVVVVFPHEMMSLLPLEVNKGVFIVTINKKRYLTTRKYLKKYLLAYAYKN